MNINYLNLNPTKTSKLFIAAIFCLTLITSCSNDDDNSSNPDPVNTVELFTNVTLTFTNTTDPTDVVVMTDIKPDGQEGDVTVNDVDGPFTAGESYALTLDATDASNPDDIEDKLVGDVIPEADEHFFKYAVNTTNFTMTRDDEDIIGADGAKLGLNTTWVAGDASTGNNLQIILVHVPATADDSNEFGSTTGGDEDFNITFTGIEIQ